MLLAGAFLSFRTTCQFPW